MGLEKQSYEEIILGVQPGELPVFDDIELSFGEDGEESLVKRIDQFLGNQNSRLEFAGDRLSDHLLIFVVSKGDYFTERHRNVFISQSADGEHRSMMLDVLEALGSEPQILRSYMPADRILTRIANQAFEHYNRMPSDD